MWQIKSALFSNRWVRRFKLLLSHTCHKWLAKEKNHLFVYKTDQTDKTTSHIKVLQQSERIEEMQKCLVRASQPKPALKKC